MDDKKSIDILIDIYEETINRIASLEKEENVKNYIQAIKDKEAAENRLRLFVVKTGVPIEIDINETKVRVARRMKISYNIEEIQEKEPEIYAACLEIRFSNKKAKEYPELNDMAEVAFDSYITTKNANQENEDTAIEN